MADRPTQKQEGSAISPGRELARLLKDGCGWSYVAESAKGTWTVDGEFDLDAIARALILLEGTVEDRRD